MEHEMELSPQGKEPGSSGNTRELLREMLTKEERNRKPFFFFFYFVGTVGYNCGDSRGNIF